MQTSEQKTAFVKGFAAGAASVVGAIGAFFAFKSFQQSRQRAAEAEHARLFHSRARVVFVLGGPGSGKGTQCAHIVKDFGYIHLSAGDLLREEQTRGGPVGEMIKSLIAEGKIVPVEVTLGLLRAAIQAHQLQGHNKFLVDGFPRNQDNLQGWNNEMCKMSRVEFCLYLECTEEEMERRLLSRGQSSGRSDDNLTAIKKRFRVMNEQTQPVVEFFRRHHRLRAIPQGTEAEVRERIAKVFHPDQLDLPPTDLFC